MSVKADSMCGICGGVGIEDSKLLRDMCSVLEHRGPDDQGFYLDKNIMLGNRRLSIIDLEAGRQPIHNEDESIWTSFNGEIYNYKQLMEELDSKGHSFYTKSDTEVIVHAYEEYGLDFLNRLNGMYAISLWDSNFHQLLLARDPVGIKPLYYSQRSEDTILFASEIKAILQDEDILRTVDAKGVQWLLNLGYIPGERTLFTEVKKLRAGHYIIYRDQNLFEREYWTPPRQIFEGDEDEAAQILQQILEDAVKRHMVSDVPIGAFLSGGLDTSTIVALMSRVSEEPVKTFTMGFGEATDEFDDARLVAEYFGTEHHELITEAKDLVKEYPRLIWSADTPKINLYPYLISRLVRRYVKVVLSGIGGDELFGGYIYRYRHYLRAEKLMKSPYYFLAKITSLVSEPVLKLFDAQRLAGLSEALRNVRNRPIFYLMVHGMMNRNLSEKVYGSQLADIGEAEMIKEIEPYFRDNKRRFIEQALYAEFRTKLVDDFLVVDDAMTMANSLEERVPLLDKELVEFAFQIPFSMKLQDKSGKLILKKAISNILPEKIIEKPKWGFSVDIASWYEKGMQEIAKQIIPDSFIMKKSFLKPDYLMKTLRKSVKEASQTDLRLLWLSTLLELWYRIYVEGDPKNPKLSIESLL